MTFKTSFVIEGLPKTYNSIGRQHWSVKAKEARLWIGLVRVSLKDIPSIPFKKAKLTLTRFSTSRPDPDGLASSFKHVIDGLVRAGVIENDKFENIGSPEYKWEKGTAKKGFIKVEIESEWQNEAC